MTLRIDGTLLLAGAGNMGHAMLAGWLERGLDPKQIVVQDPSPPQRAKELIQKHGIDLRAVVGSLREPPAVVVVAVKPQSMDQAFPPLAQLSRQSTIVLSVAAGRRIDGFERYLPKGTPVVRCMPNTPSLDRPRHHGRGRQRARHARQARHLRRAAVRRRRGGVGR